MPHVSIEFSKGLEETNDMQLLCEKLFTVMSQQEAFDNPTAIKIRATPVEFFHIGSEPQAFVHATLLLLDGRDEDTRAHLNQTILDVIDETLSGVGSITVKEIEMNRSTYASRLLQV